MKQAKSIIPMPRPVLLGAAGHVRTVVMNRSKITMHHDGMRWWNVKVVPA